MEQHGKCLEHFGNVWGYVGDMLGNFWETFWNILGSFFLLNKNVIWILFEHFWGQMAQFWEKMDNFVKL